MANEPTINWEGKSGAKYKYWIYPIKQGFSASPANYIYARETKPGSWRPIYIGETGDISDRPLDTHHKRSCIVREQARHIHVHKSSANKKERTDEEADLVARWNPVCND